VDDLRLLERVRQGDENAFAELFARHRAAVYRYAAHMCGYDAADDVLQEVFLALLQQLDRYDPGRSGLPAYLIGIARRQALKRLGGPRLDRWPNSDDVRSLADIPNGPNAAMWRAEADSDPFESLSRAEAVDRLRASIATLQPVYREAIVLCDLNELDYATAAAIMQCPMGTVRSRLHRARALLVKRLAETNAPGTKASRMDGKPPASVMVVNE
jgi:RNA polymerase sigma-70 factor (ECF subfamily)